MINKYKKSASILCSILLATSCAVHKTKNNAAEFPKLSLESHRGGRGLHPENTIIGMKSSIDMPKVTTLEMDCHITKDKKVVVYHDDYLNPKFVSYSDASPLQGADHKGLIYDYTYSQLGNFDLGLIGNADFPQQKKISAKISLLEDLIDQTEKYAAGKAREMMYNIETKSSANKDNIAHPEPQEFSDLVLEVVFNKKIQGRTVIQSFDKRTIQYIHQKYPSIRTSYLIDGKNKSSVAELIQDLGYKPFIISPYYKLVSAQYVQDAHKLGIKVIPWTVNSEKEINELLSMGVDGIISDYPNLY